MKFLGPTLIMLGIAALVGCGKGNSSSPMTTQSSPVAGLINGKPWTVQGGEAVANTLAGQNSWTIILWDTPERVPCTLVMQTLDDRSVSILAPNEVGSTSYSPIHGGNGKSLVSFFSYKGNVLQDKIAISATVALSDISATSLTGSFTGTSDADNNATGVFTVKVCPTF